MIHDFRHTVGVQTIGGLFAVVRHERWRREKGGEWSEATVMVDGPFDTPARAAARLAQLVRSEGPTDAAQLA